MDSWSFLARKGWEPEKEQLVRSVKSLAFTRGLFFLISHGIVGMTFKFDDVRLFEDALAKCEFLTPEQARDFILNGYVVIKNAFSRDIANRICEHAWSELKEEHSIDRNDRESWRRQPRGYIRTNGKGFRIRMLEEAPNALKAQTDVLGGRDRLWEDGVRLGFPGGIIANFRTDGDAPWQPPHARQGIWHKDGWHFRHFLDSPEQGLLTVPIYTEILPQSGGTFIAKDSIGPVARLLAEFPQGFHADGTQGNGYLIPYLIEQCSEFAELTGEPGDLVLLHPYMLHRPTVNPTDRPRFIANLAIVLKEPMQFKRPKHETYSIVELAVLHALGTNSFDFQNTTPRQAYVPGPFRKEDAVKVERTALRTEMAQMADAGVITPAWGSDLGYMSNNPAATTN